MIRIYICFHSLSSLLTSATDITLLLVLCTPHTQTSLTFIPSTVSIWLEALIPLTLLTLHWYSPMCLPVTRHMLEAAPDNGVTLPPKLLPGAALPFSVQEMVVTGPPLELQTRLNSGGSIVRSWNWMGLLMDSTPIRMQSNAQKSYHVACCLSPCCSPLLLELE